MFLKMKLIGTTSVIDIRSEAQDIASGKAEKLKRISYSTPAELNAELDAEYEMEYAS